MAGPTVNDFIISQGDSLPIMTIVIARNSADELINLDGCTVTFLGRRVGTNTQPAIIQPIDGFRTLADTVEVDVQFTTEQTRAIAVPAGSTYAEMQGELEIVDADGEVLTIPSEGYLPWYIRDDIGDGTNG